MNSAGFRKELLSAMPGYSWTIHKVDEFSTGLLATGIQSSGFNRLSTLQVLRKETPRGTLYEVKSAPYGCKSPWAGTASGGTLRRALRSLQKHYEERAAHFQILADWLQIGRSTGEDAS